MDLDVKTPTSESLRELPYSELRKVASNYGIQRIMKADKLISAILSKICDDECFSTPAAKEINSSRKNKEKKFDEIQITPLITPRRGTYTVDTPNLMQKEDLSSMFVAEDTSLLDMSNITINRGSERKLRPRKVSFLSPAMTPKTPRNQSLKHRPKTPVASRTPLNEAASTANVSLELKRKSLDSPLAITPLPKIAKFVVNSDVKSNHATENDDSTLLSTSMHETGKNVKTSNAKTSPKGIDHSATKLASREKPVSQKKRDIPSATKSAIRNEPVSQKKRTTPSATRSTGKQPASLKKGTTPNFKRIHQKAFDKMESIDDFQKRKLLNSAKKLGQQTLQKSKVTKAKDKIPVFSGIPFMPSVSSTTLTKLNKTTNKLLTSVEKHKGTKENTRNVKSKVAVKTISKRDTPMALKSKSKFDLKESLSRRLSYKPHRGPLKPLSVTNSVINSNPPAKEAVVNKVVQENRSQNRSLIRGVRMNKRFELQMKNRKLV